MNNRHTRILELVTESERIEVAKLAELLGVSQVTVRKDLDQLEEKGLIRREHGFALHGSDDDINGRLAYHYDVKRRIAQEAASLVGEGETVMIESGSCCALLAEELARTRRELTIITNSAFIAGYIRQQPYARIVLLGGDYQNESQVMVGPIARKCLEGFFVNRLFIGTDGFNESFGFVGSDHLRAEMVRDMAKSSAEVYVLTESEKFRQQGGAALLPAERVHTLITDDGIPAEKCALLEKRGVEVRQVPRD